MRTIASAVTTPQPPAVVSTAVRGPSGRGCVANVAAASNASSMVAASRIPACAHIPVEHAVVGRQAPGVARRRAFAAAGRSALDEYDGLPAHDVAHPGEKRGAVGHALDVRESDRARRIVGVPIEIVGDAHRGRVACAHGAADADAGLHRPVLERRNEVPGLARDRDATGRRIRSDDLGAKLRRRRHHALSVGAGEHDAEFVGERDEFSFGAAALVTRFAVARARQERGAYSAPRARAQQFHVGGRGCAYEHEVPRPFGNVVDARHGVDAEHGRAFEIRRRRRVRRSPPRECCAARRTRTCRDASTRRPRSRRAVRTRRGTVRRSVECGERSPRSPRSFHSIRFRRARRRQPAARRRRSTGSRRPMQCWRRIRRAATVRARPRAAPRVRPPVRRGMVPSNVVRREAVDEVVGVLV